MNGRSGTAPTHAEPVAIRGKAWYRVQFLPPWTRDYFDGSPSHWRAVMFGRCTAQNTPDYRLGFPSRLTRLWFLRPQGVNNSYSLRVAVVLRRNFGPKPLLDD
jgi:hypothetical protein